MLSRLISLLSRIPAVKWAFNRLRPLPHSVSIDAAQIAAEEEPALIAAAAPVAEDNTTVSVIEESPSAALTDINVGHDSSRDTPAEVEPVIEELVFVTPVETETVSGELSELVTEDEPASVASVELEPVAVDETPVIVVDADVPAPVVAATSIDSEPASSVAAEIEPVVGNDPLPVAAIAAEETIADAPVVAPHTEPEPVSPAPKSASTPKPHAKAVEPADRAALIRQRWAETGIRMWNPRLHGTGDATLNIQGRIGLLPPEPGETMPRYDKLEFKMLGGQIACEGVIVEAPVHAGQRSFTRLAEPRGADRSREPMRERQAALA